MTTTRGGTNSSSSSCFLSAAQPTDQGEESVVLLLVVGGGPFFSLPCAVFWGVKRQKTLSQKGCEKAKTLSQKGCEKAKTSSKILFSTPQISESIPFLFLLLLPPSVLPLSLCSAQQSLRPTLKK